MSSSRKKRSSRSGAANAPQAPASPLSPDEDDAVDPYAEFAGRDWGFHVLPDAAPLAADERELHALMKAWRHGRASRTIGQVLGDAYFMIFSLVVMGAMVVNLLLTSNTRAAGCVAESCLTGRTLLPWGVLFAIATLTLSVARIFGPVLASAAEGSWLMDAPLSRTRLLGGRLGSALIVAAVVGALVEALVALLAGVAPLQIVGWALAGGAVAAALIAIAASEQTRDRRALVTGLRILFAVAAVAVIAWMVAIAAGVVALTLVMPPVVPWIVAAAAAAVAVVFALAARRRLNEIRRARLLSGGSLVAGMQGAMFALDLGLARDILVEREAVERGYVQPTTGRGVGVRALIHRDVQRLVRFPKPFLGLLAAALVPYAADALGVGFIMPFLAALALVAALVPFFGSLRVLSRTGGLARTFPFSTRELRNATMVVPAVLMLLWVVAVFPAVVGLGGVRLDLPDAALRALMIGVAGLLGAVRWQTAKQVDFNTPMVATNAGAMPPSLIFNLFRGIDICALITAPLIFGAPIWVSAGLAVLAYFFLGIDLAEMQEEANEQRRQLDAEKAARAAADKKPVTKQTIARPKR